jgi:hypothetical protein
MTLITPAQLRCLRAWWDLYEQHGREPSLRQLSAALNLADNGAAPLVRWLDRKGAFKREPITVPGPRQLTPTGKKWLALAG